MQEYHVQSVDRFKLKKFFSNQAVHTSIRHGEGFHEPGEGKQSPVHKIGQALKKSYIAVLVISASAAAGLVHDRHSNPSYAPVGLDLAIAETAVELVSHLDIWPGVSAPRRPIEAQIDDYRMSADPIAWFTDFNIRTPSVRRALAQSGVHWIGDGYIETGDPDVAPPISPAGLRSIIVEVARMKGGSVRDAVELMEASLDTFITSRTLCMEGERIFCEVMEIGIENFERGFVSFDAMSGVVTVRSAEGSLVEPLRPEASHSGPVRGS